MRNVVLVTLLILASPILAAAQTQADEHAIYRAVLARFMGPEISRMVLTDSTRTSQIDPRAVNLIQQGTGALPNALLEDFNQRNTSKVALPDSLRLPVPVELMTEAERAALYRSIQQAQRDSLYNAVQRHLPGSAGIISLSRPGISPEGDLALISVFLDCGSRCGSGSFVLLRRWDAEWQVEHWITLVRS